MLRITSLRASLFASLAVSAIVVSSGGCQIVAGLGGEEPLGKGGTGGTTTAGGTGGGGGTGLTGTCTPEESQPCYSGADGTKDTGLCKGGTATCGADSMWSACEGEVVPQLEDCAAPTDENCDEYDCAVWSKVFDGDVHASGVKIDAEGNVIMALTFSIGIDLGDGTPVVPVGGDDLAILKYDKTGKLLWKKVVPAGGYQSVETLAVDKKGNISFAGSSDTDIDFGFGKVPAGMFVVKLDPTGKSLWSVTGSGSSSYISNMAVDSLGNVFAAGSATTVDFGTGLLDGTDPSNFFVIKLASDTGATSWAKITRSGSFEGVSGLSVDPSDSLVIMGVMKGTYLSLSGDASAPSDVYNCCGAYAPFLMRLDPDGNYSNGKTLAGYSGMVSVSLGGFANDALGTSIIVGSFSGAVDFQSGSYDAGQGNALFIMRDQTSGFDQTSKAFIQDGVYAYGDRMGLDGHGNIVINGNYGGPFDLGGGVLSQNDSKYVAKLDKDGNFIWARTYSFGDGGFTDMAVGTLEDETALIGNYYGGVDVGMGPLTGSGVFLVRLGK